MGSKEYVGTVGFNMAGEQEGKTNYMVNTVLSGVLSNFPALGKSIVDSHVKGPGRALLSYYKWATKPNSLAAHLGQTVGALSFGASSDTWSVKTVIGDLEEAAPYLVELYNYSVGPADIDKFVTKYMLDNHPRLFTQGSWEVTKVDATVPPTVHAAISLDGEQSEILFTLDDYDVKADYLYAEYSVVDRTYQHPQPIAPDMSDPEWQDGTISTEGYQNRGSEYLADSPQQIVLNNRSVIEVWYSDGRPGSTTTYEHTVVIPFVTRINILGKTNTHGEVVGGKFGRYERLIFVATVPEVTENIVVQPINSQTMHEGNPPVPYTRYERRTEYQYQLREKEGKFFKDKRFLEDAEWAATKMLILKRTEDMPDNLQRLFGTRHDLGQFFPVIPVRLANKWIQDAVPDELFKLVQRGYKKATSGGKLLKLQKKLTDDPENQNVIDDLDYIFVVPGTSLLTVEDDALRCVFELFRISYKTERERGKPSFNDWLDDFQEAVDSEKAFIDWTESENPIFDQKPERKPYPPNPMSSLAVRDLAGFNVLIQWAGITYTTGPGLKKPNAKKNDCWVVAPGETITLNGSITQSFEHLYSPSELENMGVNGRAKLAKRDVVSKVEALDFYFQKTTTEWECFRVWGLVKHTRIHHLIATLHGPDAVLNRMDNEAEANSFIIPLHRQIYKELKLVSYTQATLGILHIHINWYVKVKKKWYQSGIFKILVIIVIIVIAVYTGWIDANTIGMLGSNGAVGAAITGASAMTATAVIVGAIANAVAGVVVGAIVMKGSVAVFGEEIGLIIGSVLSFVAMNWQTIQSMSQTMSVSTLLNQLTSPQMLTKLALSATGPVSNMLMANANSIMQDQKEMMAEYQAQIDEIKEMSDQMFSRQNDVIEIISNALRNPLQTAPSDFFQRTLITGTDFADMTMDIVSRFSDISLTQKLPGI